MEEDEVLKWCFPEFKRTGDSFEIRIDTGDNFTSAIGRITIHFSVLEDYITKAIEFFLCLDSEFSDMITSDMTFRKKVDIFESLVFHYIDKDYFDTGNIKPEIYFKGMLRAIRKCAELRNKIMHSSWPDMYFRDDSITRRMSKKSKGRKGVIYEEEKMDAAYLLDIDDYIVTIWSEIEEYFECNVYKTVPDAPPHIDS